MEPEAQKPFACKVNGCGMSFSNEDHLNVHTKKHDMNLNLGSKSNVFVADQTPTPTRFIRTCDEVGLFEELLSNPFEQTFRRAVESKTISISEDQTSPVANNSVESTILDKKSNDDMLHTPHIYPNYNLINENEAQKSTDLLNSGLTLKLKIKQKRQMLFGDQTSVSPQENSEPNKNNLSIKEEPEDGEPGIGKKIKKESPTSNKPIKILPKPNNHLPNLKSNSIVTVQPVSIHTIQYTDDIVKQKLKASILKSNPSILPTTALPTPNLIPLNVAPQIAIKEQQVKINASQMTSQVQKIKKITTKQVNETDKSNKSNKNYANAGNRAAAKRYRNRLKLKQEDLKLENTQLKEANKLLQIKINKLEMLLSKHKDCNLTRELQNSNVTTTIQSQNGTALPILNVQNLNNLPKIVINDSVHPSRLHISYHGVRKYSTNTHYSVK